VDKIESMSEARLKTMMEQTHTEAFGWALYCCRGDREAAADLLQSAYVSILDGRARFEGRSSFKTWLFAVLRRSAARRGRLLQRALKLVRERMPVKEADAPTQEAAVLRGELRDRMEALLRDLSQRQQQVLRLVFYHGLTIEEAAHIMEVSVGSARTHYERGKRRLHDALERSGLKDEIAGRRDGNQAAV
jgi:RNA polymerase sigma factor (sigma-70 family)